jgi:hypothetical protein
MIIPGQSGRANILTCIYKAGTIVVFFSVDQAHNPCRRIKEHMGAHIEYERVVAMKPQLQLIRRETGAVLHSGFIETVQEPHEGEVLFTVVYRPFLSTTMCTIQLKSLGRYDGAGYRVQLDEHDANKLQATLEQ